MNCKSQYSRIIKCLDEWEDGDLAVKNSREVFMKECTRYVYDSLKEVSSTSMRLIKEIALREFYAHK